MNRSYPSKTNPRRIPRTQADVDKAWNDGVLAGVSNATTIFLTVCVDKFGMEDQMQKLWEEINKLSQEIAEHRVSVSDLKHTLLKESGIKV